MITVLKKHMASHDFWLLQCSNAVSTLKKRVMGGLSTVVCCPVPVAVRVVSPGAGVLYKIVRRPDTRETVLESVSVIEKVLVNLVYFPLPTAEAFMEAIQVSSPTVMVLPHPLC